MATLPSTNNLIYKYPLAFVDSQKILMPLSAKILCVQTQGDEISLWACLLYTSDAADD